MSEYRRPENRDHKPEDAYYRNLIRSTPRILKSDTDDNGTWYKMSDYKRIESKIQRNTEHDKKEKNDRQRMGTQFDMAPYMDILTAVVTIEKINEEQLLLPNKTLGFVIYDSCYSEVQSVDGTLRLLSGQKKMIPNYSCSLFPPQVGIIGDMLSSSSLPVARLLGVYRFPQISHGASLPALSDKNQFPSFARTTQSIYFQPYGLAQLIMHYDWTWVGILASDNDFGITGSQQLKEKLIKSGFCVQFYEILPSQMTKGKLISTVEMIKRSTATVIIIYAFAIQVIPLMEEIIMQNVTGKIWIGNSSWIMAIYTRKTIWKSLHGTVGLMTYRIKIPGLKEFFYGIHPSQYPNDIFIKEFWETTFNCKWPGNYSIKIAAYKRDTEQTAFCTGLETLETLDKTAYNVDSFPTISTMHNAVYTLVHALHDMLSCRPGEGPFINGTCGNINQLYPWQLFHYIMRVNFINSGGQVVAFDQNGDVPALFDILNWQLTVEGIMECKKVGMYNPDTQGEKEFIINDSAILWSGGHLQIPRSVCSEPCSPGHRKVSRQGEPVCCFDCTLCPEGEISNRSGSSECIRCPEDYWTNAKRDVCIPKGIEFLSYDGYLGFIMAIVTTVFSLTVVVVLCIFLIHHNSTVVKANNRDVSYILLVTLMFCFLSALLFVGYPRNMTCLLRQAAFGILFSLSVSSILAKTVIVVLAFNATRPGSILNIFVGPKTPFYIMFCCSVLQVVICTVWLATSAPFPEYKNIPEKIIVQCNEGSVIMFYCMLGYLGFLASVSFIVAFLARNLPDKFNEAKYITFSMIIFISVWLSFIPAYLSTSGKYMVAVEVFAIISSSGGLLICIFFPKCYIILLRTNINARQNLTGNQSKIIKY
ncbi:vomeronasal type-2 receptor 1-like [Protopterus annectens]|uniref:vomeronasal type-2 receptor 1-like n=1 Tax=Protopterus annectens TaxID=7888 RepID=UPI001CFB5512|nr:vomeronasal type-2 receptor 1-like [Protopterus annectens]